MDSTQSATTGFPYKTRKKAFYRNIEAGDDFTRFKVKSKFIFIR